MKLIGYHLSPFCFDRFDINHAGTQQSTHPNSALGIWFWSDETRQRGLMPATFGGPRSFTYVAEIEAERPCRMSIDHLARLARTHHTPADYRTMRNALIELGCDHILISESAGFVSTIVVLHPAKIRIVDRQEPLAA